MAVKKGGLGRGLDALFADRVSIEEPTEQTVAETIEEIAAISDSRKKKSSGRTSAAKKTKAEKTEQPAAKETDDSADKVQYIDIHSIKPNANQPRKTFNEEKIAELAESIREHGVIQPLVVRKRGSIYEIVAGERRWRASMKAEMTTVPCLIREFTDEQNMLVAIIENMQREDLNPLEEAEGLNQMVEIYGLTQEQVSKGVGKSRPYITNALRLLKLPEYVREAVRDGSISAAHGRTLVTVENEEYRRAILDRIIKEGLSVRETEKLAAEIGKKKKRPAKKTKNPDVAQVEAELKDTFGTRVNIRQSGKKGKIEIEYYSREELERVIELLRSVK